MFEYKGYTGRIDFADSDTGWFTGSVEGIQDVVTFEGKTVPQLQKAFRESVEEYLKFCNELKEAPEKPFSGKFVLRLSPELHRLTYDAARQEEASMNTWITKAVEMRLKQSASSSGALSFEELEQVADCVAAILHQKRRSPAALKQRSESSKRSSKPKPANEEFQRVLDI